MFEGETTSITSTVLNVAGPSQASKVVNPPAIIIFPGAENINKNLLLKATGKFGNCSHVFKKHEAENVCLTESEIYQVKQKTFSIFGIFIF